uniref:Uncharacterized protein n=1 Tax=Peronospora matthiolae TaxID=2874970 RepID=A0AAV1U540_9STRA
MVSKSIRCASEAARNAFARMRAVEESSSFALAAGNPFPAVAIRQQVVPLVNSPRGKSPSVIDTSAASAAGTATRNVDEPRIEIIYSGESDNSSGSKATPYASESSGAETARARLTGSGERGGIMPEILRPSDSS